MVIQNIKVVNDRGRNESNHMKATGEEREAVRETDELLGGSRGVVAIQISVVVHGFTARGRDRGGVVRSKTKVCHGERRGQKGEQEHIK